MKKFAIEKVDIRYELKTFEWYDNIIRRFNFLNINSIYFYWEIFFIQ